MLYILLCDARFSEKGQKTPHRNSTHKLSACAGCGVKGKHLAVRAQAGRPSRLCSSPVIKGTTWWRWEAMSHTFQTGLKPGGGQGPHKSLLRALQKSSGLFFYHVCHQCWAILSLISPPSAHWMSSLCLQTKAFDKTWREADGTHLLAVLRHKHCSDIYIIHLF